MQLPIHRQFSAGSAILVVVQAFPTLGHCRLGTLRKSRVCRDALDCGRRRRWSRGAALPILLSAGMWMGSPVLQDASSSLSHLK